MPTAASTMHGGRAKLYINGNLVGTFSQASWGVSYDSTPIYTLGRLSPEEIVQSGQDPISVSCTGWRVVKASNSGNPVYLGPYDQNTINMPMLQNVLNQVDSVLQIQDRQTDQIVLNVIGVKVVSFSTSLSARGLQEQTIQFMGINAWDESGPQSEAAGAVGQNFN